MEKVIIIGSGPAGYTAAIYASRAGLKPVLLSGLKVGGQLVDTGDVENFPGYKNGISGPLMMEDLREQAIRFGTEIYYSEVISVDLSIQPYKVVDDNNKTWETQSIIISTGAEAKLLGIQCETEYWGRGVSACATCDGFFFKNQDVIVVGGGDTACEEALYLSNLCTSVTVLVRSDKMRASLIMQNRISSKPNIKVLYDTFITNIEGYGLVQRVETNNGYIHATGVFIAIGHKPNTSLFRNQILLDKDGYIQTRPGSSQTSVEAVFACGDVQDSIYRQAITAAGSGCMAALDCERYLNN